jgi:hypothetical protein
MATSNKPMLLLYGSGSIKVTNMALRNPERYEEVEYARSEPLNNYDNPPIGGIVSFIKHSFYLAYESKNYRVFEEI